MKSGKFKFKFSKFDPITKKITGIIAATLISSNKANKIFKIVKSFV